MKTDFETGGGSTNPTLAQLPTSFPNIKHKIKCLTSDCPNMMAYNSKTCRECQLKLYKNGSYYLNRPQEEIDMIMNRGEEI